eukprot:jgi/Mesvir1/9171/Mv06911-RA.1
MLTSRQRVRMERLQKYVAVPSDEHHDELPISAPHGEVKHEGPRLRAVTPQSAASSILAWPELLVGLVSPPAGEPSGDRRSAEQPRVHGAAAAIEGWDGYDFEDLDSELGSESATTRASEQFATCAAWFVNGLYKRLLLIFCIIFTIFLVAPEPVIDAMDSIWELFHRHESLVIDHGTVQVAGTTFRRMDEQGGFYWATGDGGPCSVWTGLLGLNASGGAVSSVGSNRTGAGDRTREQADRYIPLYFVSQRGLPLPPSKSRKGGHRPRNPAQACFLQNLASVPGMLEGLDLGGPGDPPPGPSGSPSPSSQPPNPSTNTSAANGHPGGDGSTQDGKSGSQGGSPRSPDSPASGGSPSNGMAWATGFPSGSDAGSSLPAGMAPIASPLVFYGGTRVEVLLHRCGTLWAENTWVRYCELMAAAAVDGDLDRFGNGTVDRDWIGGGGLVDGTYTGADVFPEEDEEGGGVRGRQRPRQRRRLGDGEGGGEVLDKDGARGVGTVDDASMGSPVKQVNIADSSGQVSTAEPTWDVESRGLLLGGAWPGDANEGEAGTEVGMRPDVTSGGREGDAGHATWRSHLVADASKGTGAFHQGQIHRRRNPEVEAVVNGSQGLRLDEDMSGTPGGPDGECVGEQLTEGVKGRSLLEREDGMAQGRNRGLVLNQGNQGLGMTNGNRRLLTADRSVRVFLEEARKGRSAAEQRYRRQHQPNGWAFPDGGQGAEGPWDAGHIGGGRRHLLGGWSSPSSNESSGGERDHGVDCAAVRLASLTKGEVGRLQSDKVEDKATFLSAEVVFAEDAPLDTLRQSLPKGFRAVVHVRDPRDLVVSGYFYHLAANEAWLLEPKEWFDGLSYQEYLQSVPKEQGLHEEMKLLLPPYLSRLKGYLTSRDPASIAFMKYEDMWRYATADAAEYRTVASWFGLQWVECRCNCTGDPAPPANATELPPCSPYARTAMSGHRWPPAMAAPPHNTHADIVASPTTTRPDPGCCSERRAPELSQGLAADPGQHPVMVMPLWKGRGSKADAFLRAAEEHPTYIMEGVPGEGKLHLSPWNLEQMRTLFGGELNGLVAAFGYDPL